VTKLVFFENEKSLSTQLSKIFEQNVTPKEICVALEKLKFKHNMVGSLKDCFPESFKRWQQKVAVSMQFSLEEVQGVILSRKTNLKNIEAAAWCSKQSVTIF